MRKLSPPGIRIEATERLCGPISLCACLITALFSRTVAHKMLTTKFLLYNIGFVPSYAPDNQGRRETQRGPGKTFSRSGSDYSQRGHGL